MAGSLKTAQQIIIHLTKWGEISRFELTKMAGASEWLTLLKTADVIKPITHSGETVSWSFTPNFWSLLGTDNEKAVRTVLYQIPKYRNYLISILTEGVVTAAKHGMVAQLETWSGNELLPFLSDMNAMLNQLEINGKRIINEKTDQIPKHFEKLPERQSDWDAWNQLLLGRTARPHDLFDFALKRFVPYAFPEALGAVSRTPAILPIINLQDADGNAQFTSVSPASWNIQRSDVQSSIALFDEDGKALRDLDKPEQCKLALQDAMLEQPFYKATTHLAINAYRSISASAPGFEFFLSPGTPLNGLELFFEGKKIGFLKEWLSSLLTCQECFSATTISDDQVGNMMENLIALEILDQVDDNIVLHPEFQSSLMAGRLRTVFRPGKLLQSRMVERVKELGVRS